MSTIYGVFTFTCIFNTIEFVECLLCVAYTCGKTGERKHSFFVTSYIYLFKVNNRNTGKKCEICSKLTIKTPGRGQ